VESEIIVLHTEYTKNSFYFYVDSSLIFLVLLEFVVLLNIMSTVFCGGSGDVYLGNQRRYRIYLLSYYLHLSKSVMYNTRFLESEVMAML
jgi:hypothetical protein